MNDLITLIDYGGSNLRSVQKALEAVGARPAVTADPDVVRRADKLVLPGVGAFGAGMAALRARGLDAARSRRSGRARCCWASAWACSSCSTRATRWGGTPGWASCPAR